MGIAEIGDKSFVAALWIAASGLIAFLARGRLRAAEGIRPRRVKSGELYKRANVIAKRNAVRLDAVYIVPYGRGRITNAFGGLRGIAVTDDYGHWLHATQLDFIIGHELAHLAQRHGIKKLVIAAVLFSTTALSGIWLAKLSGVSLAIADFSIILAPLLIFYFVSRHYEFEADRIGVQFAGENGPAAVCALGSLYHHIGAPVDASVFEQLFQSHPNLWQRIAAISRSGNVPPECIESVRQKLKTTKSLNSAAG